jgi:hypothetical protein
VQLVYDGSSHWFFLPVEGLEMKQINTFSIYELARSLHPLRNLPQDPSQIEKAHFYPLFHAQWWLDGFVKDQNIPLDLSLNAATELSAWMDRLMNKIVAIETASSEDEKVKPYELQTLITKLDFFEHVLSAELQKHLTYVVSQIGGLSMPLLVNKAEVNLTEDALKVVPESARKDFREAGRCLAFETPTAAGFHAMRATEAVLRVYFTLITKQDSSRMDWGTCTQELMRSGNANRKVIQVLDQIRDVHRNPLMHPQDFLSMKEAIGLFDIAKSAINAVAEEISALTPKLENSFAELLGPAGSLLSALALPASAPAHEGDTTEKAS